MQEGGDVGHLRARQVELRHPLVGPARGQELAELAAVLVGLHERRSGEIGTARTAPRIRAVAEAALIDQELLPAIDGGGVGHRRQGLLLRTADHDSHDNQRRTRRNRRHHILAAGSASSALIVVLVVTFHAAHLTAKQRLGVPCAP